MSEIDDTRADRFSIPLKVSYSFGRVEGTASLVNISYTGALLEDAENRPVIGTPINLYIYLKPPFAFESSSPSELAGTVSRYSPDDFAILFGDSYDPYLIQVVDSVIATVAQVRPQRTNSDG